MFEMIVELLTMLAMLAVALLTQNTALTIASASVYLIIAIRNMRNEV